MPNKSFEFVLFIFITIQKNFFYIKYYVLVAFVQFYSYTLNFTGTRTQFNFYTRTFHARNSKLNVATSVSLPELFNILLLNLK